MFPKWYMKHVKFFVGIQKLSICVFKYKFVLTIFLKILKMNTPLGKISLC